MLTSLSSLLLIGCAGPRYTVLTGTEGLNHNNLPVWPTGDVPRYQFAGVYYGEQNLKLIDAELVFLEKAAYWLVGLFDSAPDLEQLESPQGGLVDDGVLYVVDTAAAAIFVFDKREGAVLNGQLPKWQWAAPQVPFRSPIAMAKGADEQFLVTDAELGAVFRLDKNGNPLGSFGKSVLNRPTGLARDSSRGEIYVADTQDHDIKVFDDSGRLIRTLGRRGTANGQFNFPIHLTFAHDSLYVVDSMNARIQRFDAEGKHLLSFGSRGRYQGQFGRPKGVTVDTEGNIYVVDSQFDHLLVYSSTGEFLLPIGGPTNSLGQFYLPAGVWTDGQDHIYVADMGNNRVIALKFLGGR